MNKKAFNLPKALAGICLNKKGFNLFTALVAVLLLMLAVLLVNSMAQSEGKTSQTINDIESRSKLEAVAEMARADAMQVFNYHLRKKIEDWLTNPLTGGLTLQLQNKTWQEIQTDFAESKFGGPNSEAFADFTANAMIGMFYGGVYFGNYKITLEGSDTLKAGLKTAVEKSIESKDFFTVIECENGDPKKCEKGTFYVNLHLEQLTQEEYEKLPRLNVLDNVTGKELKQVILPRTTFRIYVPLRFFKAIAETRALMHYPDTPLGENEEFESFFDTPSDIGLFSPKTHNLIEGMALGMCDEGYCNPRSSPFTPPENTAILRGYCPGDNQEKNYSKGIFIPVECPTGTEGWCSAGMQYNASDNDGSTSMKKALTQLANAKACDVAKKAKAAGYIDVDPDDSFTLVGGECDSLAQSVEINVEALKSKKIVHDETGTKEAGGSSGFTGFFDAENCPYNSGLKTGKTGLYKSGGDVLSPHISYESLGCSGDFGPASAACAQVTSVKVTLAFKEEYTTYMVNKKGDKVYRITVYDNTYVPFAPNWDSGEMDGDCLYSWEPTKSSCSVEQGNSWKCISLIKQGKDVYEENGCTPA